MEDNEYFVMEFRRTGPKPTDVKVFTSPNHKEMEAFLRPLAERIDFKGKSVISIRCPVAGGPVEVNVAIDDTTVRENLRRAAEVGAGEMRTLKECIEENCRHIESAFRVFLEAVQMEKLLPKTKPTLEVKHLDSKWIEGCLLTEPPFERTSTGFLIKVPAQPPTLVLADWINEQTRLCAFQRAIGVLDEFKLVERC